MLKLYYTLAKTTKTCYVFQRGEKADGSLETLHLRKEAFVGSGVNSANGITICIEEGDKL